jgi:hypothetical protein
MKPELSTGMNFLDDRKLETLSQSKHSGTFDSAEQDKDVVVKLSHQRRLSSQLAAGV